MFADSARPDPNGYNQQGSAGTQSEQRELRRATSLLRLLKTSEDAPIEDEELRREFQRLNQLLQRIDQIAEQEEHQRQSAATSQESNGQYGSPDAGEVEPDPLIDESVSAFDPSEFEDQAPPEPDPDPGVPPVTPEPQPEEEQDDNLARWWVNFNGDVSLERLARLRAHLRESPFTIETRFEEITDGLIVLRVVTEKQVSMNQIDWILRQLMDLVGLDRNSAILSRQ